MVWVGRRDSGLMSVHFGYNSRMFIDLEPSEKKVCSTINGVSNCSVRTEADIASNVDGLC